MELALSTACNINDITDETTWSLLIVSFLFVMYGSSNVISTGFVTGSLASASRGVSLRCGGRRGGGHATNLELSVRCKFFLLIL
jgi:hypothetical protein